MADETYIPDKHTAHERLRQHSRVWTIEEGGTIQSLGEDCLDRAFEEYDIPLDRGDVDIATSSPGPLGTHASAGVYGCRYTWEEGRWEVLDDPDGYIIYLYQNQQRGREFHKIYNDVRHELAHIVNWELDGYTQEAEGNHAEWLERLDASERAL